MFLQLWQDAASGSFTHQAHRPESQDRHAHGHAMAQEAPPQAVADAGDPPSLSISPFVVSDWGVPVLHVPSQPAMTDVHTQRRLGFERTIAPTGRLPGPEPPPPRFILR
jgi:hypothetical protein